MKTNPIQDLLYKNSPTDNPESAKAEDLGAHLAREEQASSSTIYERRLDGLNSAKWAMTSYVFKEAAGKDSILTDARFVALPDKIVVDQYSVVRSDIEKGNGLGYDDDGAYRLWPQSERIWPAIKGDWKDQEKLGAFCAAVMMSGLDRFDFECECSKSGNPVLNGLTAGDFGRFKPQGNSSAVCLLKSKAADKDFLKGVWDAVQKMEHQVVNMGSLDHLGNPVSDRDLLFADERAQSLSVLKSNILQVKQFVKNQARLHSPGTDLDDKKFFYKKPIELSDVVLDFSAKADSCPTPAKAEAWSQRQTKRAARRLIGGAGGLGI